MYWFAINSSSTNISIEVSMKVQLGIRPNCSEWDQELNEDDWILPDSVLMAIEEAKLQVRKEWD